MRDSLSPEPPAAPSRGRLGFLRPLPVEWSGSTPELKAAAKSAVDAIDEWQISRIVGLPELEHEKAIAVARARTALRAAVALDR